MMLQTAARKEKNTPPSTKHTAIEEIRQQGRVWAVDVLKPEKRALLFVRSDLALEEKIFKIRHFLLILAIFKIRSSSARSDLKNKTARFSGKSWSRRGQFYSPGLWTRSRLRGAQAFARGRREEGRNTERDHRQKHGERPYDHDMRFHHSCSGLIDIKIHMFLSGLQRKHHRTRRTHTQLNDYPRRNYCWLNSGKGRGRSSSF